LTVCPFLFPAWSACGPACARPPHRRAHSRPPPGGRMPPPRWVIAKGRWY